MQASEASAAEDPLPCPQKSCASVESLKASLVGIQTDVTEIRGHLSGYESRLNSHMDAEEKLSAHNAEELGKLTIAVGGLSSAVEKMQNQEQIEKVRKDAAKKTVKRIIWNISLVITPVGAIIAFMWAATGAHIVFGAGG